MKNIVKNFFVFFIIFLLIAAVFSFYQGGGLNGSKKQTQEIGVGEMINKINNGEVSAINIEGDEIELVLKNQEVLKTYKESNESFSTLINNYRDQIQSEKLKEVNVNIKQPSGFEYWMASLAPFLVPVLFIILFIWILGRQVQGMNNKAMNFGKNLSSEENKANEKKQKIMFKDVAGVKEAKEELQEVVEFLKSSKKFTEIGAKIPKGVLLVGPPGTGKTLMAKAVAGEAGVPFFNVSGSEFVEMFVGVGASRVRALFQKAKKNAPCIVFIDELDAIGRQRGAGLGGSHDEREQTLNQILTEMDGFEPNNGVVVLAATNRPDVLDAALLRPGRFDRRVVVDLPDINDRVDILKTHATNKPFTKEVDLRRVAQRTPGFSGADLANLLNEAAILAARGGKKRISMDEILPSIEKVVMGPERKSRVMSEKEKRITAYHEAGHALAYHFMPHMDPVQKVSIIGRGMAGGYTLQVPLEDKHMKSKTEFLEEIAALMGGYAAEKVAFGEITTGAQSDLNRATRMARKLVTEYGMSERLGPRTFGHKEELVFLGREISEQRDYSENTAREIDQEISDFVTGAYNRAYGIIKKEKALLDKVVDELMEKEILEKEDFEKIAGKKEAQK